MNVYNGSANRMKWKAGRHVYYIYKYVMVSMYPVSGDIPSKKNRQLREN